MIKMHRERIPEDVLQKAEGLALEQLKQQQDKQLAAEGKVAYDRKAAQSVVETFLTKYDPEGRFAALLKANMTTH